MSDANDQQPVDEPPPLAPGERSPAARKLPEMPERPALAESAPRRERGRLASTFLSLCGILAICLVLFVCSGGNVGAVIIAAGIFLFAMLHYLLWGWWLGGAIRRQVQTEERGEP